MTPQDQYAAYLAANTITKALNPPPISPSPIKGRFLATLIERALSFWTRHRDVLLPFLQVATSAALDLLLANITDFQNLDPPGPA